MLEFSLIHKLRVQGLSSDDEPGEPRFTVLKSALTSHGCIFKVVLCIILFDPCTFEYDASTAKKEMASR